MISVLKVAEKALSLLPASVNHGGSFLYLLRKALNQKKCRNEKFFKSFFTSEKVNLDYLNLQVASKTVSKKLKWL